MTVKQDMMEANLIEMRLMIVRLMMIRLMIRLGRKVKKHLSPKIYLTPKRR